MREKNNNTVKEFIKRLNKGDSPVPLIDRLISHIEHLARLITTVAHVVGIDKYVDPKVHVEPPEDIGKIQLILLDESDFLQFPNTVLARHDPAAYIPIDPTDAFHALIALLSSAVLNPTDDMRNRFPKHPRLVYLCSDNGWSLHLDIADNKDPSQVRPERIYLRRGTPTDSLTLQRKFRIRDGPGFPSLSYPEKDLAPEIGEEYEPRCVASATTKEYWRILPDEFEHTIYYWVKAFEEWKKHTEVSGFEEVGGFREFHESVWQTFSTPRCNHCSHIQRESKRRKAKSKLGSDAAAIIGWSEQNSSPVLRRIIIFPTKGDKNIRWLAVKEAVTLRNYEKGQKRYRREVMLRTQDCCEECALTYVASQEGKWVIIL